MPPCWTVNVNKKLKWPNHAAVAVRSTIYFFSSYCINEDNLTTRIGLLDVQAFETDTYQWRVLTDKNFSKINKKPDMLTWRSAVVYDEKVYLFADINKQDWNVLFCFDTNTHLWTKPIMSGMVPAVRHRAGHSTCVVNDSIYIFGGFDQNSNLRFQDVYKLDLKSLKWSHVPTTGAPALFRVNHSATAIDNRMFIFGGLAADDRDLIYLDTQTMHLVKPEVTGYQPVWRIEHSAVCYKGQLLIFGGFNHGQEIPYNGFMRYDPDCCRWSLVETKGNGPRPRYEHSSFLIKDRVFIFGGLPSHLNDIRALDFAPSLKTLATLTVLEHKLDQKGLPETIQADIKLIYSEETQSKNNAE